MSPRRLAPWALAVIVAVGAAGAWAVLGGRDLPMHGCHAPSDAPAASGSQHVDPVDAAQLRWTGVTLPDTFTDGDQQQMHDVVAFDGGFVAAGTESSGAGARPFVIRSTDGLTWEEVGAGPGWRRVSFQRLAAVGDRLFAIGSAATDDRGGSRGAVWYTDDGTSWSEARGDFANAVPSTLAGGGSGLVMVGRPITHDAALAWRSSDGAEWEPVELDLPVPPRVAGFSDLAAHDGSFLGVGWISEGVDRPAAAVAWRSDDGVGWTCTILDGAGFEVARAFELHAGAGAWFATGGGGPLCGPAASCPGAPLAWVSSDGLAWTDALGGDMPVVPGGMALGGGPDGFVAAGQGTTASSPDGLTWVRANDGESGHALHGQADALAIARDGSAAVAVGTEWPGDGTDADAWLAVAEIRPGD